MTEAQHTPTVKQREILNALAKCQRGKGHPDSGFTVPEKRVIGRMVGMGWCEKWGIPGLMIVLITNEGRAAIARATKE